MCYETKDLVAAVKELLDSEDNTGCTEDLTVVSKEAVDKLALIYPQFAPDEFVIQKCLSNVNRHYAYRTANLENSTDKELVEFLEEIIDLQIYEGDVDLDAEFIDPIENELLKRGINPKNAKSVKAILGRPFLSN